MAAEAPTHIHLYHGDGDCHMANITVAAFAIKTGNNVHLMAEINKAWQCIHPNPFEGFLALPISG